jgi:hypothetical protein
VLPGELTKNEQKFLDTYKITPIDITLAEAVAVLAAA